jgi:pimeloyl-ACP methyl ester carboxylesterase
MLPGAAARSQAAGAPALHRCRGGAALCGTLDRALDPKGIVPGRIGIYFELYPHRAPGPAAGTVVATEGGPGYPATESRADYLSLFAPLRTHHDLLLMDNRGTGRSDAVDCAGLQRADRWTTALVGECGRSLGSRAPLYSTAYAADDLAALLDALKVDKLDLYGDSYGTYFEQVFALRHGGRLRSIVLDGAYPLDGPDEAWYPTYAPAMRAKFNLSCARTPECAALPGDSIAHMEPALDQLRQSPFPAQGSDATGKTVNFRADAAALAIVLFGGAPALTTTREADAAARAFAGGDRTPLLRLMAETTSAVDSRDPQADPRLWSAGLAAAVMCQDAPQIFDMRLAPPERAAQRDSQIEMRRRIRPDSYAPFSIDEFRAMPLDYSFIDQCVEWPVADAAHPPTQVVPPQAPYPDVPALILSGELDDMTTVTDGTAVAREFKRGRQIVVANSFHVNAVPRARSVCGAQLVRRFVLHLDPGTAACAADVPPVRVLAGFAREARQLSPAHALPGNQVDPDGLRVAAAVVLTLGDAALRSAEGVAARVHGLRGGSLRAVIHGRNLHVSLYDLQWTEDVGVSGAFERPSATQTPGLLRARVTVRGPGGTTGELRVQWPWADSAGRARIDGQLGGAVVAAEADSP